MESCLKFLPRKSYNTFGWVALTLFISIGVVIIGITSDFESKATLQCNPDKTIASDLSTRKYIETQCLLKYAQEFYHFFPLNVMFGINFGLVLVLSIVYAYTVKHRVEIFAEPPHETGNGGDQERRPLSGNMSPAALDPGRYRRQSSQYFVFTVYVLHLIICRILPLAVFAALLLNTRNLPSQFDCPWPINPMSTSNVNATQPQGRNVSIVDCIYPTGSKNEKVSTTVITINLIFGTEAFIELAYLLWSSWKDRSLLSDVEFCRVYLLRKRKEMRKVVKKLIENVPNEFFELRDDFKKIPSGMKYDEIYVKVIIQDGRQSSWTSRRQFDDRHESYETHLETPDNAFPLSKTSDLFKPTDSSERNPRTILVVGRPGIGKTTLTKKILHEWQGQVSEFWHRKIVILIHLRSFNQGTTSLREMLKHAHGLNMSLEDFNSTYEQICSKPEDFVFIFDGLDELRYDKNSLPKGKALHNLDEKADILQIFMTLVKGTLLPGATVLTTSRPTAEHIYKELRFDREVEILGFNKEQIKSYVENFCRQDKDASAKLWKFIEKTPEYLGLSYIPFNCYTICLTLKEAIDADNLEEDERESSQSNVPRTITELYKRAVTKLLYRRHGKNQSENIPKKYIDTRLPDPLQNDFKHFTKIARKGMIDNHLVFEFDNDVEHAKWSDCGLIDNLEDRRYYFYCFLHLTIQEFLAAQHVVDDMEQVESFLIDHIDDPKWHLVIQFVAGLIGDKIRELRKKGNTSERSEAELSNEHRIMEKICNSFQAWMPKYGEIDADEEGYLRKLLAIKCVHEMQDVGVREKIMTSLVGEDNSGNCDKFSLDGLSIAPAESAALFEFLGLIKNLQFLSILGCRMEPSAYRELAYLLKKDNKIKDLRMKDCSISDDDAKHVIDALSNENCKVTTLDLDSNNLTSQGAKYLHDTLRSDQCKLTELFLSENRVQDTGAKYLSEALMNENCRLSVLRLNDNHLTEKGAKYLSGALKNENCKLEALFIDNNELTDESAKYFSDALKSKSCKLTRLDISYNELTDKSAEYLSDSLKSDNCNLTELDIYSCGLTSESAKYFGDALKSSSCKLTILDVSDNKLTDEGAKYLSDALKSDNCKLTELDISRCGLTSKGKMCFNQARRSNDCKIIVD